MRPSTQNTFPFLRNARCREEDSLPAGAFVGRITNACKYALLFFALLAIGMGCFLYLPPINSEIGLLFGVIGLLIASLLPTYFSYRCFVDKTVLKATYLILCFRITKKTLWKDVKYKKVKRDALGNGVSIALYDTNRKKLISFDALIVGFDRIVKTAKHLPKLQ